MSDKKPYKNIVVIINTIDVKTEKVIATQTKTIDGKERREWLKDTLYKASMWAMFNGCYVEIINKEDDKE